MTHDQFLESWDIHDRINTYLLAAVSEDALQDLSASKGRTVGEQFAHIHNVRLMWLKAARPDLHDGVEKLEKTAIGKAGLANALNASASRVRRMLADAFEGDGKIKNFKPHAAAFLGYLISHESHHRGQIVLTLKQAGHPLDKKTPFGLWEWGVR